MYTCNSSKIIYNELPPGHRMSFNATLQARLKYGYATRLVPITAYGYAAFLPNRTPCHGDLVLTLVKTLQHPTWIESADGRRVQLIERDCLIGVYGNCYTTQQYEGLIPHTSHTCQLLDAAGICGVVLSKHSAAAPPTELSVLGFVHSPTGRLLNLADFGLPRCADPVPATTNRYFKPLVIAVVGSSSGSGKTTAAASMIRGLTRSGYRAAACKATGAPTGNDGWIYRDIGACTLLNFLDCGFAGTYLCRKDELLSIYRTLYHTLSRQHPDVIVIELGNGLAQRETSMLLEHPEVRASIDGVLYTATDSPAAESGVRWLQTRGYHVLGISGLVSASPLAAQEAEVFSGIRCYTREELMFSALNTSLPQP